MAEKWTKTSALPSDGAMNPKPLSALNHLTVPCAILAFLPGGAPPLDEEAGRRGASRQEALSTAWTSRVTSTATKNKAIADRVTTMLLGRNPEKLCDPRDRRRS